MVVLQWSTWDETGTPEDLTCVDFFPLTIDPEAASQRHKGLHAVSLPSWGITVVAHAQANDDHIRLVGASCSMCAATQLLKGTLA